MLSFGSLVSKASCMPWVAVGWPNICICSKEQGYVGFEPDIRRLSGELLLGAPGRWCF